MAPVRVPVFLTRVVRVKRGVYRSAFPPGRMGDKGLGRAVMGWVVTCLMEGVGVVRLNVV